MDKQESRRPVLVTAVSHEGFSPYPNGDPMSTVDSITTPPVEASVPTVAEIGEPITPTMPKPPAPDPFDPARLRLSQNLTAALGVKKHLTTVPVRKPSKEWFVRCHPDPTYRLETYVVDLKEDAETYLVDPNLWDYLAGESTFSPRLLITAINKQGTVFIWPIRLPGADGRHDDWSKSALVAANFGTKGWVRVQANMSLGAYDVYEAASKLSDPEWPTLPLNELLRIAFKDRFIDSPDHLVLKRLRGER
jgi:hypothetical protein